MEDAAETYTQPALAALEWQPKYEWWFQQRTLPSGEPLDVIINPSDADRHAFLSRAAELLEWALHNERAVLADAVRAELLTLYNDVWRNEEEPVLSADELIGRLEWQLLKISGFESVPIELSYYAGDMFGGHDPTVQLDGALRFRSIDLRG